jgi:hypothetical protein
MTRITRRQASAMSCNVALAQDGGAQQPALQCDAPATVGAGPTDRERPNQNQKGGSVTTDDRGVTTTQPNNAGANTTDAPVDRGNDSGGTSDRK